MSGKSGPHIRKKQNAPQIYLDVVIALLPCCVAAVYAYGLRAGILLLYGALLHAFADHLFARFVRREEVYLDLSGLISGLILVLLLPPTVSLWVVSAGVLFSSIVVKQFFGGVGCNLFNPALAGRAFLAGAFSETTIVATEPIVNRWVLSSLITGPAGEVSAVPGDLGWIDILSGQIPGAMGLTGVLFAAAGGVYLLFRGIIKLQTPTAYLITLIAGYWIVFFGSSSVDGMIRLFATSGFVFFAVFALGDFSTVPTSGTGRIAFGIGAGSLTLLLLLFGETLPAVISPILLMNVGTPVFEFYIRPRVFARKPWYSRKEAPSDPRTENPEVNA
ncbi:MAG: RnfABCDGE type electron transport complex subunit D [Clostridiales bacterium]|nr:RnfABCDGE type electron transport complex subunit D [Clostridiales bacterium]